MKFFIYLILFFGLFNCSSFAEDIYKLPYKSKTKLQIANPLTISELENNISYFKKSIDTSHFTQRDFFQLAFYLENAKESEISIFKNSAKIVDWPELQDYLNQILKKIIPKENKQDTAVLKVFISNSPSFNASASGLGVITFNIGCFEHLYDEATIAALLCHEYTHYKKKHSYENYCQYTLKNKGIYSFFVPEYLNDFSKEKELEADSVGLTYFAQSGYHISGWMNLLKILRKLEKNIKRKMKYNRDVKSATHPIFDERFKVISRIYNNNNKENKGDYFLISSEIFNSIKNESKLIQLEAYLESYNFHDLLSTSFKYHLFEPDAPQYIYYLIEGIRRYCYLNPKKWSENFITDVYFEKIQEEKEHIKAYKKELMKKSIFEELDPQVLLLNDGEIAKITAGFYWEGTPKFKTYEEAFEFYNKVAENLNCTECKLSYALSLWNIDKEKSKETLLNSYLTKSDALNKKYASLLVTDSINNLLNPNTNVFIFLDPFAYINFDPFFYSKKFEISNNSPTISKLIDTTKKLLPNTQFFNLNQFDNLEDKRKIILLANFSLLALISIDTKPELYILDPSTLDFFAKYETENFIFYRTNLSIHKGGLKNTVQVPKMEFEQILNETKCTRYITTVLTTLRMTKDYKMKIRIIDEEPYSVDFNKPTSTYFVADYTTKLKKFIENRKYKQVK